MHDIVRLQVATGAQYGHQPGCVAGKLLTVCLQEYAWVRADIPHMEHFVTQGLDASRNNHAIQSSKNARMSYHYAELPGQAPEKKAAKVGPHSPSSKSSASDCHCNAASPALR